MEEKKDSYYLYQDGYFYKKLRFFFDKIDSLGVESRGIERIEPYERQTDKRKAILQVIGLWLAAAGGLSSLSSFVLGPLVFELGLKDSFIYGQFGQFVGCVIAAYCSIMGPRSGCRQMVTARFLFGWWFVKFVALVSILSVMGWSVTNSVLGGEILKSISDDKCPLEAGVIIVACISLVVSIFGIRQLLKVETLLSIPILFSFFLMYISMKGEYKYLAFSESIGDSATVKGHQLSFFALAYSVTSTWGSIASDYYIVFPETASDIEVFTITFLGILIPTTFTSVLGLLLGNIAFAYALWDNVYEKNGLGGLLTQAFHSWGRGARIFPAFLFLSLITNNILNSYSAAFGIQLAGLWFARIPRFIWVIVVTAVYLVAAIAGREHFSDILGNFLPMIGYWISFYFIILLEENMIFRTRWLHHLFTKENEVEHANAMNSTKLTRKQYYNWNIWNDHSRLTHGIAAFIASLCGIAGAVVGMDQTYYVGPMAKLIGEGGDLGMWLSMAFAGAVYPVLRYIELKVFGR